VIAFTQWRLLDFSSVDPKLNVAVNEALLIGRHNELCSETLRLWTSNPLISIPKGISLKHIDVEACRKLNVAIVRRCSAGDIFYSDTETLNFSLVLDEKGARIPSDPSEAYEYLYSGVELILKKFGFDVNVKYAEPLLINGKVVSMASQHYYYDVSLFEGVIFLNSDLSVARKVLRDNIPEKLTTLGREIGRKISIGEMKSLLSYSYEEALGVKFNAGKISDKEKEVLDALYKRKYGLDEWNIKGEAPLTLKDALIEIYIANPPTSLCHSLLSLVDRVIADLRERVEMRIYCRGMGHPRGVDITRGLWRAIKNSVIPAVIVNGELKFGHKIPPENELKKAIKEAIERK
jgi:lipoate-protein ligase A